MRRAAQYPIDGRTGHTVTIPPMSRARTVIPIPTASAKRTWELWLLQLTSTPTAAGREHLVQAWLDGWLRDRLDRVIVKRDAAGNLLITRRDAGRAPPSVLVTAHLDHPAFVIREIRPTGDLRLEFRGGVLDAYFTNAAIELIDADGIAHAALVTSLDAAAKPFKRVSARLTGSARQRQAAADALAKGDIGRWVLPAPRIGPLPLEPLPGATAQRTVRCLQSHACDDLAAAAAALAAFDLTLRSKAFRHVGLLFTVAEEVGFIGAIHAARSRMIPRSAALINLETSRSFPQDSPIGAGPIVRVGDRMSVFSPRLNGIIASAMSAHAAARPAFRWQRKLMAGGACESSAFAAYGFDSTCLCLPLGNYHNMGNLAAVQAAPPGSRAHASRAKVAPEVIAVDDFHGLVEMIAVTASALAPSGRRAPARDARRALMEKLYAEKRCALAP